MEKNFQEVNERMAVLWGEGETPHTYDRYAGPVRKKF